MDTSPRALALFDFDGTLISGDSIIAYLRLARRLKAISAWELLGVTAQSFGYKLGWVTEAQAKTRALRFRAKLDPMRRQALDLAFARECLLPRVYPGGLAALRRHQEEGRLAVLVSASTENYMQHVAEGLGVDALLCTQVGEDGAVRRNCKGEEKVRRVIAWAEEQGLVLDLAASYAYGDSKSDLPMLHLCGHPVLVNAKRALRKAAPDAERVTWKAK